MNTFAETANISALADIETSSRGTKLFVGENSMIDAFVKIKFVGGSGDIKIGNETYINSGCVLYSGNGIQIGNNVLIAANCTFAPVNHQYASRDIPISKQGFMPSRGGIIIEDDVWIGAGVVILDGSHIKRGCVIGAGTIVSGHTEEFGIYYGNPIKLAKYRK